jgi:hypothetical protein
MPFCQRVSIPADHDADRSKPGLRYCGSAKTERAAAIFPFPSLATVWPLREVDARRRLLFPRRAAARHFFKGQTMRNLPFDIPDAVRREIFRPVPIHPSLAIFVHCDRMAKRFWPHIAGLDTNEIKKVIFK